ncbi:hypothetical protein CS063_17135 [Sporanaerobium hydrogeniformans]|uniref:Uncharacterized protein n=1 Tax=Sporanaerobium hydrogeniformans TaxID=3072179 RepID=A0AC61D654_9FIRM|nr:DUF1540 domain-containing protein [Sporanaerobium hydrogeniformans]PHV69199.1 hypothetical protein CS063_17135 [Sporanaerobium hydrogeniformans]
MPILECSAHNCSYNRENKCCLAKIQVGRQGASNPKDTYCNNFTSGEYTNSNEVHHTCDTVDITCMAAGCIYNDNSKAVCRANEIQMGNKGACCQEDTDCLSFVCR